VNRSTLISGKPVSEFSPDEYYAAVTAMYEQRTRASRTKPQSHAPGLTLSRTKKGALSVRRSAKTRAFAYVTLAEVTALAKALSATQAEVWTFFKLKKYIIAKDRMEAERIYSEINEIPWK
jgi:hypothetical protein